MKPTTPSTALAAVATVALLLVPAHAQQERDIIELIKSQLATNRQALVAENLKLSQTESEIFWPLYREFQAKREPLINRRIDLLREFRDNFDGLTDDQAAELIDGWLALDGDIVKLRRQYVQKFRKALPEKLTLRYFQIENKLDTIINYDLAQVVPLAE